jgi:hypothetical protein
MGGLMRFAILSDDKTVENIIEAESADFCKAAYPGDYVALQDGQWCDIGAVYDGKGFAAAA